MIVLGEVKGAEAWDLLMGGKFGTAVIAAVHADSSAGAFEALAMAANPAVPAMSANALVEHFARLFEVVIYCDVAYRPETDSYLRQVTEIGVVLPQVVSGSAAWRSPLCSLAPRWGPPWSWSATSCPNAWKRNATGCCGPRASISPGPKRRGGPLVNLLAALLGATAVWFLAETLQGRRHALSARPRLTRRVAKPRSGFPSRGGRHQRAVRRRVRGRRPRFRHHHAGYFTHRIVAFIGWSPALHPLHLLVRPPPPLTSARAWRGPTPYATSSAPRFRYRHPAQLPGRPGRRRASAAAPAHGRLARRSAQIGSLGALEAVRAELADPVSDQVLLTFAQAVSEGTDTVLRTWRSSWNKPAPISLFRTGYARPAPSCASRPGRFVAPLFVLVLFCTVSAQYRAFFDGTEGSSWW